MRRAGGQGSAPGREAGLGSWALGVQSRPFCSGPQFPHLGGGARGPRGDYLGSLCRGRSESPPPLCTQSAGALGLPQAFGWTCTLTPEVFFLPSLLRYSGISLAEPARKVTTPALAWIGDFLRAQGCYLPSGWHLPLLC